MSGPILAATYDGAMIRTFLNGVEQSATAASGSIPVLGDAFPQRCDYSFSTGPPSEIFGIGLGNGVTAGIRQLRIWNQAVPEAEILANASLHLNGTESGLVGLLATRRTPGPDPGAEHGSGWCPVDAWLQ